MLSLKQVNDELINFRKFTGYNVPDFTDVVYEDTNSFSGEVNVSEMERGEYILHLCSDLKKFHTDYITSIIWHEATHLYDYLTHKNIMHYIKTWSEVHATEIQNRYLLKLSRNQKLIDINRKLHYCNYFTTYLQVIFLHIKSSKDYLTNFSISKDPDDFNLGMVNYMYLCGTIRVLLIDRPLFPTITKSFPEEYQQSLLKIGESSLKNDIDKIIMVYRQELNKAKRYSISDILENINDIHNRFRTDKS